MFLDNFVSEVDTAMTIAADEDKMKKAYIFMLKRLDDVTSD